MRIRSKAVWSLAVVMCLWLAAADLGVRADGDDRQHSGTRSRCAGCRAAWRDGDVATHVDTGTRYETVANAEGRFSELNVRVGRYTLQVTMSGFKDDKQENVEVQLGADRSVDFKMQLASVTETVNVIAESSPLDISTAGTASNISQAVIESLPTITRSITDFARVSPFVNPTTLGSNGDQAMSIAGRHNRYNNMQIDGAVNNDLFGLADTGTPGGQTGTQPISLDAIQEVQVVVRPV